PAPQASRPGDAETGVDHRIFFCERVALQPLCDVSLERLAQLLVDGEKTDMIDPEPQPAILALLRPLADQILLFAFADAFHETPDDTIGGLRFQVAGLAFRQGVAVHTEE